ncbi:hypothetical protein [Formosa sp. PL04]|uniref:hypothetical protein n=1 Tax=Formosa sp. PL04 TaxID=3081755 RepID=UPI00298223C4|nr:hypothetical protein [Formosa sp. PL04]MDW5288830.1 hypothetical protein [Formosa sp. PL04]
MKRLLFAILVSFSINISFAQEWMTNLDVAERLALVQNKLLVVVWQNSYYNGAPAYVNDGKGNQVFVENMYEEPVIDSLIWAHFIPVVLSENAYPELYESIEMIGSSSSYLGKFKDDSLKVMDANGNILNISEEKYLFNLSDFILKYSMDTSFLETQLTNYKSEKNFYSAFYLAAQYMDFAIFGKNAVRPELVGLASIYLNEASGFLENESLENKPALKQRVDLLDIEKDLVLLKPKKVLRKLNKIKESEVEKVNANLRSFLYLASYKMLQDEHNASMWESKVNALDKKKIMILIDNSSN